MLLYQFVCVVCIYIYIYMVPSRLVGRELRRAVAVLVGLLVRLGDFYFVAVVFVSMCCVCSVLLFCVC